MLFMSLPVVAPFSFNEALPIVAKKSFAINESTYGVCTLGEVNQTSFMDYRFYMHDFLPKHLLGRVLPNGSYSSTDFNIYNDWADGLIVKIIHEPANGKMIVEGDLSKQPSYQPNYGFIGKDSFEVLVSGVDLNRKPISRRLVYFVNVLPDKETENFGKNYTKLIKKYCGGTKQFWRMVDGIVIPTVAVSDIPKITAKF
jgi:hypothetical protein